MNAKSRIQANANSDFGVTGLDIGIQIIEAIGRGYAVARQMLTEQAIELAGLYQQTVDFLAGYAAAYIKVGQSDGVARTRKSEAKKIFEAAEILVNKLGKPEALAKMQAMQGDFAHYLTQCRDIIALESGEDPKTRSGKSQTAKKLSAEEVVKFGKRLAVSPVGVAAGIMEQAQKVYIQNVGTPENLCERIQDFASELEKSSDKYYQKLGREVSEKIQKAREHAATVKTRMLQEEQKRVDEETKTAKAASKAKTPTPASATPEVIQALEQSESASDAALEQQIADLENGEQAQA